MNKNMFINSNYSLEDLEEVRDKDGFIDLSKIGLEITNESREKRGTEARLKNWVNFNGQKALIRGEAIQNYSIYAELIVEEIAKQLGIETAHYDLIKVKDEEGKETLGVLSESIIDFEEEELITLHDLIGDEIEYDDMMESIEYEGATKYTYTIDKLRERFTKAGYDEENIENIIKEYQKRLIFYLSVIDTDKHPENIAFIKPKNGEGALRLSPNYDSEFSLLLEYELDMVDFFLENQLELESEVDIAYHKIGIHINREEGGLGSMWKDTLEMLCEDDEIYDYYINNIKGAINMDTILENVEKRIKAPLPERVKDLAKKSYKARNEQIEKTLAGEELEEYIETKQFEFDPYQFLSTLVRKGIDEEIRTIEQVQIGREIENLLMRSGLENEERGYI